MSPADVFLLSQPAILLAVVLVGCRWSAVRREQEAAAARLIAENPDAEFCDEVLRLRSPGRSGKQFEVDGRVRQMQEGGWTFLRISEASPWISLVSWGGAVRLHFLRTRTAACAERQSR